MAKKQASPRQPDWNDALDTDGDMTVPVEEQAFLLPDDWDPFTHTDGRDPDDPIIEDED